MNVFKALNSKVLDKKYKFKVNKLISLLDELGKLQKEDRIRDMYCIEDVQDIADWVEKNEDL